MAETFEFFKRENSHFTRFSGKTGGKRCLCCCKLVIELFFFSRGSAALPSGRGIRLKIDYGRLPNVKEAYAAVTNERCVCALEEIWAPPIGRRQPHDDKWEGSFVVHLNFFRRNGNISAESPQASVFESLKVRVIWRISGTGETWLVVEGTAIMKCKWGRKKKVLGSFA